VIRGVRPVKLCSELGFLLREARRRTGPERTDGVDVPEAEQRARGTSVQASALAKKCFILQLWCVSFAGVASFCDPEALEAANNSAFLRNERIDRRTVASFRFSRTVIFKWTITLFICTVILRGELDKIYFYANLCCFCISALSQRVA